MEFTTLKNGNKVPMEGFGVFQIRALDHGKRFWTMTLPQQEEKFLAISLDD